MTIFDKVIELQNLTTYSKHEQLVYGIINSINDKILVKGDILPSVNQMVEKIGFARKTIVKAYTELKERGIIESKNRLYYFVVNDSTEHKVRVGVLLYAFHDFQQIFYNTLRESLGENFQLDVYFHHNNPATYESLLNLMIGRQYTSYVVAPIHDPITQKLLSNFSTDQLLLIDRFENIGEGYSYISQEFEETTYQILSQLTDEFKRFDELTLFFKEGADYPEGTKKAFERYIKEHQFKGNIEEEYLSGMVKKGTAYITIGDIDLWGILKDCNKENFSLGTDIGILAANDSPVKEIISGGITTFFADFKGMANKAADFVNTRNKIQEILPVKLWRRKSL